MRSKNAFLGEKGLRGKEKQNIFMHAWVKLYDVI
jgi:hypothetical protein